MATPGLMFATSLLVLSLLILRPTSSEVLDSTNDSADCSRAQGREEVQCPAVCAACPACPSAPPCVRRVPPGYLYYQGLGYYKLHYDARTWHDAVAACEAEGGYLAVINSQEEADLINSLTTKHGLTSQVLIGFTAAPKIQKYLTVLGDDLETTGYTVWGPGQPDGPNTENCGGFGVNEGLHDVLCTAPLPSFCELD